MRFRPLIGYLLILCATIIVGLSLVYFFKDEELLAPYIAGFLAGGFVGHFVGCRAFLHVEAFLIPEGQINNKEAYELLGPRPHRWLIEVFIFYYMLNAIIPLAPEAKAFWFANAIFIGLLNGSVVIYYFHFAAKVFLRERILNSRIILTVE